MRIAVFGDVIGQPGRKAALNMIRKLKESDKIDFFIVNGENAAGGIGLTPEVARELYDGGADVITSGNHIWNKREMVDVLDSTKYVIRPFNYPDAPGKGYTIISKNGFRLGVVNIQGRTFMQAIDCPFKAVEEAISLIGSDADAIVVDFHAEATSEKVAMGFYLDGKVAALFGTHTHVQTADERVLDNKTAYITDLGMCGPINSVIGMAYDTVINKFLTGLPTRFEVGKGKCVVCGAVIDINHATGKATDITRINEISD